MSRMVKLKPSPRHGSSCRWRRSAGPIWGSGSLAWAISEQADRQTARSDVRRKGRDVEPLAVEIDRREIGRDLDANEYRRFAAQRDARDVDERA